MTLRASSREPLAEPAILEPNWVVTLPYEVGALPVADIVRIRDAIRGRRLAAAIWKKRKVRGCAA
jgi:hypothetical protein